MNQPDKRPQRYRRSFALLAILFLLFAWGCAAVKVPRSNYIVVHKEGYPIDHAGRFRDWRPLIKDKSKNQDEFQDEFLDLILSSIDQHVKRAWDSEAKEIPRLLLFVHGGLNTYRAALKRVRKFLETQKANGYPHLSSYYLLFINWNASLYSSWWDDLFVVRRGKRTPWSAGPTAPFALGGQLGKALLTAPRAWFFQVENAVDSFRKAEKEGEPEEHRVWVGITYFVPFPIRALTVPFLQGFGTPAWDMMKRHAKLVLADTMQPNKYGVGQGAGRTLLEALKRRMCKTEDGQEICKTQDGKTRWMTEDNTEGSIDITLVGHSMGTLVLNDILRTFPEIQFQRIIYMAAASSIDDFDMSVLPYLRRHKGSKFWGFSLSESDELREVNYVDLYQRGSLLVWIDNYFQRILTPTQRVFGRYRNYHNKYVALPSKFRLLQVCVGKFSGTEGEPTRHGDFAKPEIVEKILGIVEKGKCPDPEKRFFR